MVFGVVLISLVLAVAAGADRGAGAADHQELAQENGPPCPDIMDMVAEISPKHARVNAGRGLYFLAEVRDNSSCASRVHRVEICVRGNKGSERDLRLPPCVAIPLFTGSSGQIPLRVRAKKRASGRYALKFVVSETFDVPQVPTQVVHQVARADAELKVSRKSDK